MLSNPSALPKPASPDSASLGIERWQEYAAAQDDDAVAQFANHLAEEAPGRALLEAVFGNSPFLGRCLLAEQGFVQSLLHHGPDRMLATLIGDAREAGTAATDLAGLMTALRRMKRRAALLIGLADIAGAWTLDPVVAALSDAAEAALQIATGHLLRSLAEAGAIRLPSEDDPETGSGLFILGMGKLGGRELNYSSDIDLIVLYDRERIEETGDGRLQEHFVRLTRDLIRAMDERTADGYVFRTDLRLRPDPGATPLAMSALAAETYYESMGQNWERAAMIKARPVAGDREAGKAFLGHLKPFIWRKSLDFAAIQDIHSIKRQIAAHRGGDRIAVAGHNVKLGRGGIREIEFFAQTQQLIWGGRDPSLRMRGTCDTLRALAAADRVAQAVADEMIESYGFLRRVEHRLQMINDQQTQTLPKEPAEIGALAVFLGYPDGEAFAQDLMAHLHRVETHYGQLFEDSDPLGGPGSLVFTGSDHDPDTITTLEGMGFAEPETVSALIRTWHHGRYRATRSVRARELLTELTPALLAALGKTANPDGALVRFDGFLSGLPAGVQLFSLFAANPQLLDVIAEVMGSAPDLAQRLGRNPALLDALLDAEFLAGAPDPDALATSLESDLRQATDFQDVLDISRRWTNDHRFQMGLQTLLDITDGDAAGKTLSQIADTVVEALQAQVQADFSKRHGTVANSELCVIGFGKLGGEELAPGSDLDLVFVFDCPEDAESSEGERPLTPGHYFARLGQSLISAITAPTGEGSLYEIDMRLRPSGDSGSLVPSLQGFIDYEEKDAWIWEHMALTRARPITGSPAMRAKVSAAIGRIIGRPRDEDELVAGVHKMRERMARHHQAKSLWDMKHMRGGLVDIEFIAQYLMLRHAAEHPEVLRTNTTAALDSLAEAGLLDRAVASDLIATMQQWRRVHGMLRLTFGNASLKEEELPEGLRRVLVRAGRAEDFDDLKYRLASAAERCYSHFRTLIEAPANAVETMNENSPRETTP